MSRTVRQSRTIVVALTSGAVQIGEALGLDSTHVECGWGLRRWPRIGHQVFPSPPGVRLLVRAVARSRHGTFVPDGHQDRSDNGRVHPYLLQLLREVRREDKSESTPGPKVCQNPPVDNFGVLGRLGTLAVV